MQRGCCKKKQQSNLALDHIREHADDPKDNFHLKRGVSGKFNRRLPCKIIGSSSNMQNE